MKHIHLFYIAIIALLLSFFMLKGCGKHRSGTEQAQTEDEPKKAVIPAKYFKVTKMSSSLNIYHAFVRWPNGEVIKINAYINSKAGQRGHLNQIFTRSFGFNGLQDSHIYEAKAFQVYFTLEGHDFKVKL